MKNVASCQPVEAKNCSSSLHLMVYAFINMYVQLQCSVFASVLSLHQCYGICLGEMVVLQIILWDRYLVVAYRNINIECIIPEQQSLQSHEEQRRTSTDNSSNSPASNLLKQLHKANNSSSQRSDPQVSITQKNSDIVSEKSARNKNMAPVSIAPKVTVADSKNQSSNAVGDKLPEMRTNSANVAKAFNGSFGRNSIGSGFTHKPPDNTGVNNLIKTKIANNPQVSGHFGGKVAINGHTAVSNAATGGTAAPFINGNLTDVANLLARNVPPPGNMASLFSNVAGLGAGSNAPLPFRFEHGGNAPLAPNITSVLASLGGGGAAGAGGDAPMPRRPHDSGVAPPPPATSIPLTPSITSILSSLGGGGGGGDASRPLRPHDGGIAPPPPPPPPASMVSLLSGVATLGTGGKQEANGDASMSLQLDSGSNIPLATSMSSLLSGASNIGAYRMQYNGGDALKSLRPHNVGNADPAVNLATSLLSSVAALGTGGKHETHGDAAMSLKRDDGGTTPPLANSATHIADQAMREQPNRPHITRGFSTQEEMEVAFGE